MTTPPAQTKASLLTPYGMAAMAVVRVTGAGALDVLRSVFQPARGYWPDRFERHRLMFGRIGGGSDTIDDTIVAVDPHADAGCTIDMTVHGGVRIVERVLMLLQEHGAVVEADAIPHPSSPWFEADTVTALSKAKTRRAVRFIAAQRETLPHALASIAALAERDEGRARAELAAMMDRSRPARYLVDGARIVIHGPVNTGKSTLVNRLVDADRSLVSDRAGTTRDWVGIETAVDGVPVLLIDTAGARHETDALEHEAVERGWAQFRAADVQLVVLDGSAPFPGDYIDQCLPRRIPGRTAVVINKSDLPQAWDASRFANLNLPTVAVSAMTGAGVDRLASGLAGVLSMAKLDSGQATPFTLVQGQWISRALMCDNAVDLASVLRSALENSRPR